MQMTCEKVQTVSEQSAIADFVLVKMSKEGDCTAFARLVGPSQGRLLTLAQRITRNRQDAEDVVQKTLLQAFVHLNAFRGSCKFSTWLTRIAINEALLDLRKKRRCVEVSLDECSGIEKEWPYQEMADGRATPDELCSQQERRHLLDGMVDRLGPRYRIIIQLRYVNGFSVEEMSRRLGISISTVKTRLQRSRVQLRKMFIKHSPRESGLLETLSALRIHFPDWNHCQPRPIADPYCSSGSCPASWT